MVNPLRKEGKKELTSLSSARGGGGGGFWGSSPGRSVKRRRSFYFLLERPKKGRASPGREVEGRGDPYSRRRKRESLLPSVKRKRLSYP